MMGQTGPVRLGKITIIAAIASTLRIVVFLSLARVAALPSVPDAGKISTMARFEIRCCQAPYGSELFQVVLQALEEVAYERRDLIGCFVKREMSCVQELDFCLRHVVGISCCPGDGE
jgi:hypothetical protein